MTAYVQIPGAGLRIPRIAEVMKENAEFDRYQDGKLWYYIEYTLPAVLEVQSKFPAGYEVTERWTFEFPIPVEDAGAGAFEPEMKAINLMRWIRKHIEFLTEARAAEDGS